MIRLAAAVLSLLLLAACGDGTGKIKGTATYRERIALPQDAVFEAELLDMSEAAPRVIASSGVQAVNGVPLAFAITYRKNIIDPKKPYAVRAEIRSEARTLFQSADPAPALTRGGGHALDLVLNLVAAPGNVADIARAVVAIEDRLGALKRSEGRLDDGAGPALTWIAFADGATPVKIIAERAGEVDTSQAASFHYSNGVLIHCASDSQIAADPSAGLASDLALNFDLYFKDGRFAGGTKTTNGVVGEPDEHEVRALGLEAQRLYAAVAATLAAAQP